MASAAAIAASVCARMRADRLSGAAACSRPAVSITVKVRSPSCASPSRRSRVTPGRSSTRARRRPTRRLNRVDLPTLGRPTMATVKVISAAMAITPQWRRRPCASPRSYQRVTVGAGGSGQIDPPVAGAAVCRVGGGSGHGEEADGRVAAGADIGGRLGRLIGGRRRHDLGLGLWFRLGLLGRSRLRVLGGVGLRPAADSL